MRRSRLLGIIAFVVMAIGIGIFVYWNSQVEDLKSWDYEYKYVPVYLIFGGVGILGIAGYYSHKEGDKFDWSKV